MLRALILLSLALTYLPCLLSAETLQEIDAEIARLKQERTRYEIDEARNTADEQNNMLADWRRYGKDIEGIHEDEDALNKNGKQIQQLEARKAQLQQKQ